MLDERLSCIAAMMPFCRGIADVGADHGLLICHLVESGKAQWGVATDIHRSPLEKARKEISHRGLEKKINCLLTDGLDGVSSKDLDGVIIAGMGGETIAHIIAKWPYTKSSDITWLLQPMTKAHRLRAWLWQNGFDLCQEKCCGAAGRVYSVMEVTWTGYEYQPTLIDLYLGRIDPLTNPENMAYCQNLLKRTARQAQGAAAACSKKSSGAEAQQLWEALRVALCEKGAG